MRLPRKGFRENCLISIVVPVRWDLIKSPSTEAIQATWVGHSTFLVQMEGVTFLTGVPLHRILCLFAEFDI